MESVLDVQAPNHVRQWGIKSVTIGEPTIELDPVIAGLPWQNTFTFGAGIDPVTGSTMASALIPFTPKQRTIKTSWESMRFVTDESDLNREIEVSASGKYNIEGVTVSASSSYLSSIKFSELSVSLIATYESQYDGYDEADTYTLTDNAQKLIQNPSQFRHVYGDYFVAGGKRSSRFTAVYSCQTTSASNMDKFMASFGGAAPEVFSAEGSTKFTQAASSNHVSVSVDLHMDGYTGTPPSGPWTPQTILQALTWFKQNEQGVYLQAKLEHYNVIDPMYPRSIGIPPEVFIDLRQLYTTVWDVRSLYASCPSRYQKQFQKDYTDLESGVIANQDILATDEEKRIEYQSKADRLHSLLNDVFSRMDFYFKVQQAVSQEPRKDQLIEEGTGQQTWMYGYSSYPSSAVVISTVSMNYKEDYHIGWREHTFEFGPDQNKLVVGWEVISNRHDGTNGSWKKVVDQNLLENYAAIYVTSEYDRGCDWSVSIFYVDAKNYQFS